MRSLTRLKDLVKVSTNKKQASCAGSAYAEPESFWVIRKISSDSESSYRLSHEYLNYCQSQQGQTSEQI